MKITRMSCYLFLFFFFSSRRRHTRCSRDWSSDVCSSDLRAPPFPGPPLRYLRGGPGKGGALWGNPPSLRLSPRSFLAAEIGRASCRERALFSEVAWF